MSDVLQLKKPLVILDLDKSREQLRDGFINSGVENITIFNRLDKMCLYINEQHDVNVVIEGIELKEVFQTHDEITKFFDIVLKLARVRIIFIDNSENNEMINNFLVDNYCFDINRTTVGRLSNEDYIEFVLRCVLNVKKYNDVKHIVKDIKPTIDEEVEDGEIEAIKLTDEDKTDEVYYKYVSFIATLTQILKDGDTDKIIEYLKNNKNILRGIVEYLRLQRTDIGRYKEILKIENDKSRNLNVRLDEAENTVKVLNESIEELNTIISVSDNKVVELSKYCDELEKINSALMEKFSNSDTSSSIMFTALKAFNYDSFKKVIYFKEISYPKYFNSFLKAFRDNLLRKGLSSRLVIVQEKNDFAGIKYSDFLYINTVSDSGIYNFDGKENIVCNIVNDKVIDRILKNEDNFDLIIIVDKLGKDFDFVTGFNVDKFYLIANKSDIELYGVPVDRTIANGDESVFINLQENQEYTKVSNQKIKFRLYRQLTDKLATLVMETED